MTVSHTADFHACSRHVGVFAAGFDTCRHMVYSKKRADHEKIGHKSNYLTWVTNNLHPCFCAFYAFYAWWFHFPQKVWCTPKYVSTCRHYIHRHVTYPFTWSWRQISTLAVYHVRQTRLTLRRGHAPNGIRSVTVRRWRNGWWYFCIVYASRCLGVALWSGRGRVFSQDD